MFDRCKSFPLETLSSINREHPQFETWSHRNILRFSHMDQHQHVRANTHLWNRSRLPLRLTERVLCYEETALRVFLHSPDLFASRCFFWHTHSLDGLPFVGVDPEKHPLSCLKPSSHCFPWPSIMCEDILMIFEGVTACLSYYLCLKFWPKVWFQSTCMICVKTEVF